MAVTSVLSAITYTQQLCQTDSNGIGSTLGIALYSDALQAMTRDMINRGLDAAQVQEAYTDLAVPSVTANGATFAWPSSMYALKTIEVNYQDQTDQNYLQAESMDVANIQKRSFSWLRVNQDIGNPLFDNRGDTFEIFPTPQTSNAQGIRIFYYLTPTEPADVGQPIQYPQTLDYRALSCKMAAMYYRTQNDVEMATVYENEYQARLNKIINILAPGTQQPITPQPLAMTGWNY